MLGDLGIPGDHISSSRTLDFVDAFGGVTGGCGVDVVLNSLSGAFIDASLGLLGEGGRFVEIGKTDIRGADDIAAAHPGVVYQAYDLGVASPEQLGRAWATLTELFATGVCNRCPPPATA